jgi:nicotinamide mononucleotide transporter
MTDGPLQRFLEGVRDTHPLEWVAVATGVMYVLLIMRQRRSGWVYGGISAMILIVLFARAKLPMNALLQFSYVVASVYGWWNWSKPKLAHRVRLWHWRGHALAIVACVLASLGLRQLLAMQGASAYPFTDSLVACFGLFATWLVARVCLENWLYWIVVDTVTIYLCFAQGLMVPLLLYVAYLGIAVFGFFNWLQKYRRQLPLADAPAP